MARMIPPVIAEDTASPGEREVFRRLRDDPETGDWTVLHSLLIADHPSQVWGEADFVVIIPGLGVLVLEVKACRSLRVEDGVWYYGWEPGDHRGPFKQAAECMHAIRRFVAEAQPGLDRVVFWSAVAFPYVKVGIRSEEWFPWQLIDGRRFRRAPLSTTLKTILVKARDHLAKVPTARWFDASAAPSPTQAEELASLLRPKFEVIETPSTRRSRIEGELRTFTEEQYEALDAMATNPRVLFTGPAGTGKTVLALEAARRAARAGRRVLLVCFNRALGRWLRSTMRDSGSQIAVDTMSGFMLKTARLDIRGEQKAASFWRDELPELALEALIEDSQNSPFDELVVDEAQDLLVDKFLDVLDLSLRGGLGAGAWRFFGDFERQAIFASDVGYDAFLSGRGSGAPIHSLRTNCRNTPRTAALTFQLGGLRPDYRRIRRPDNGIEPALWFYGSDIEQRALFCAELEAAERDGYEPGEIVVLSPTSQAVAGSVGLPWAERMRPLEEAGPGDIVMSTIAAFKGLEAPVVIVTDLVDFTGPRAEALFYVACTRPLERLTLLMHEGLRESVARALTGTGVPA